MIIVDRIPRDFDIGHYIGAYSLPLVEILFAQWYEDG